jgi:Inorganic pyrophosphatase
MSATIASLVPDRSPFEGDLQDIRRLPQRAVEELEEFFEATNALEAKKLKFLGWRGPSRAIKAIRTGRHEPSRLSGNCLGSAAAVSRRLGANGQSQGVRRAAK